MGGVGRDARRVLVVDDEAIVTTMIGRVLGAAGYRVDAAPDTETALEELRRTSYDVALVDLRLGHDSGQDILERALKLERPPVVLMMSAYADVAAAVNAMRCGSEDFLEKPFGGPELVARLEQAVERAAKRRSRSAIRMNEAHSATAGWGSTAMRDALRLADRVAAAPSSSALIVGESGVGKELVAARIHDASERRDGPFVRVNLAAIADSVLEAELFGSVKGAFTDAKSTRAGYLASADGGTILLDEIGEFRLEKQAKLLRVLEEHRFFPVGSDRERVVDVRVLAATNRDPRGMLETGLLREDLFYRLGTVIHIPPLRQRREEILPLAAHFLEALCAEFGRPRSHLSRAAEALLEGYSWPGNIRELRNAIERAIMLSDGREIGVEAFALRVEPIRSPATAPGRRGARRPVAEADERDRLKRALEACGGSRSRAAKLLGMSRSTLYDRLKRYGIV